ncbi:MAG: glycosyltransferase, partial [Oscillospiraceae bacterium]
MKQDDQTQKLQKKRNRELLLYFKQLVGQEGLSATLRRTARYIKRRYGAKKGRFLPGKAALAAQRQADTAGWPLISLCVPVYNVPKDFFKELLVSVQGQTYPRWQLCIADASEEAQAVEGMVRGLADERIAYIKLENEGISANTNRAAALATGEYLALLDHDDVLAPSALFEMAKAAHQTGAGFLYSDEALFSASILRPSAGHFKPDYSPQYLLCCNYLAHFTAFKKELFEKVGGFQPAF